MVYTIKTTKKTLNEFMYTFTDLSQLIYMQYDFRTNFSIKFAENLSKEQ